MRVVRASELFEIPLSLPFGRYFKGEEFPWVWVSRIGEALGGFDFKGAVKRGDIPRGLVIEGEVFIDETVILPPYGHIIGPAYIGAGTELRAGVFIRGNVIVGENCVLGNSCEFKNCMLIESVQTGHFNYVGDSILGKGAHFGAGGVTANVRLDKKAVAVKFGDEVIDTGMRKLGAMVGENSEIGCNAVLQPGTVVGKRAMIGPTVAIGGVVGEGARVFAAKPVVVV